jgi:tetratricopeptide (TPR) repeat protein
MRKTDRLLFLCLLGWIFILALSTIHDIDVWFNIRCGQYILEQRTFIGRDVFSFTHDGGVWINQLWLFETIMFLVFKVGSWSGLIIGKALLFTLAFGLLAWPHRKQSAFFVIIAMALAGSIITAPRMVERAEIFSFLFIALSVVIVESFLNGRTVWRIYLLPLLMVVWVNTHAFFMIGVGIHLFLLADVAVEYLLGRRPNAKRVDSRRLRTAGLVIALSFGAAFLNPFGIQAVLRPFLQFSMIQRSNYFNHTIEEFWPTSAVIEYQGFNYQIILFLTIAAILALAAGIRVIRTRKAPLFQLLLFAALFALGTMAVRNMALFVIGIVALTAVVFAGWTVPSAIRRWSAMAIIMIILTLSIGRCLPIAEKVNPPIGAFGLGITPYYQSPQPACDYLVNHNLIPKRLFSNKLLFSNYYIWRFGPEKQVFWDGRLEVYNEEFFRYHNALMQTAAGFAELLDTWKVDGVVFYHRRGEVPETDAQRLQDLYHSARWRLAYFDRYYALFLPRDSLSKDISSMNMPLLDGMALEALKNDPKHRSAGYFDLAQLMVFLGEKAAVRHYYELLHQEFPGDFSTLFLAARIALDDGDGAASYTNLKAAYLKDPSQMPGHMYDQIALLAADLQKYDEACDFAKKSLRRPKPGPTPYLILAKSYARMGRLKDAAAVLKKGARRYPDSKALQRMLAKARASEMTK